MPKKNYCEKFEYMWERRPKRSGPDSKANAYKAWNARIKDGYTEREMVEGLKSYGKHCAREGKLGTPFVMQMQTFFGPALHFEADYGAPKQSQELAAIQANNAPVIAKSRHQEAIEAVHGTIEQSLNDRSWATGL